MLAALDNYRFLLEDNLYVVSYRRSINMMRQQRALTSVAALNAAQLEPRPVCKTPGINSSHLQGQ